MRTVWDRVFQKLFKQQRTLFMPKNRKSQSRVPMNVSVEGSSKKSVAGVFPAHAKHLSADGGDINKILYVLLHRGTPYQKEWRIANIVRHYCREEGVEVTMDSMGNIWFSIGKNEEHGTMFSCHMDTVHKTDDAFDLYLSTGPNPPDRGFVFAWSKGQRQILGADDKVGCYIMLRMMQAKIPGLYVFHVGEEYGGKGSKFIADNNKELVKDIKRCIAFDRMHYGDVIKYQRGGVCCSDTFAKELSKQLNDVMQHKVLHGFDMQDERYKFKPCDGVFTDSASYTSLIPECTNLSVGYFNQHSRGEHFDLHWLESFLIPTFLQLEWSKLGTYRDPKPSYTSSYNQASWWSQLDEGSEGPSPNQVTKTNARSPAAYRLDLPNYARNDPDYTLAEMLADITGKCTAKSVFKWSHRFSIDMFDQIKSMLQRLNSLINENANLKEQIVKLNKHIETLEGHMDEWALCEDELSGALEKVDEYVTFMRSSGYEHMLSKTMIELSERYDELYCTPGTKEEAEEAFAAPEKPSPVIDKQEGVIKNVIKFNSDTFVLTVDGEEVPLYSKAGSKLDPKHYYHLTAGTKLFGHMGNQRVLVHTVTGNEAIQTEAKKKKQRNS